VNIQNTSGDTEAIVSNRRRDSTSRVTSREVNT
jgi:hypothetical protein